MMDSTMNMTVNVSELRDALDDGRFVVLTSGTGQLRARPLTLLEVDETGTLWFLVDSNQEWVEALQLDASVNVNADRQSDGRWVSVSGDADTTQDRQRIDDLWTPAAQAFWDSEDDPGIASLAVRPVTVDIWQSHKSTMGRIFAIGKATFGGSADDIGQHRTLHIAAD
jgi:general stress protein 26